MEASQAFVNSETQGGVCKATSICAVWIHSSRRNNCNGNPRQIHQLLCEPRTTQNTRWYWQATTTEDQKNDPKKTLSGEVSKCHKRHRYLMVLMSTLLCTFRIRSFLLFLSRNLSNPTQLLNNGEESFVSCSGNVHLIFSVITCIFCNESGCDRNYG